jgi:HTH-type transcriptional regulator, glycine betaine synthesis regulator
MSTNASESLTASFVALAGDVAEMVSYNRSLGQLYGFLFIAPEPLSLEEIAQGCQMSKGNASIHLRILENWNAVHRSSKPGTRKDYYVANTDLKALITQRLQEGVSKRLNLVRKRMSLLMENGNAEAINQNKHLKARIEEADHLMKKVEQALPLLNKLVKMIG